MLQINRRTYSHAAKKEKYFFVLRPTCRNFAPHFRKPSTFTQMHPSTQSAPFHPKVGLKRAIWTRSSMDRIKDSGSFDWGSTPHGFTFLISK